MCGIAGFTSPGREPGRVARSMIASIAYRGPDQQGFHIDDHIAVGHARLTIIDPVGGRQPRHDPATGDLLVFNGEIYGYRHLADELRQEGANLADQSDTEVLFALIRKFGVLGALQRIDGMFVFAFRDGKTRNLWLARDRFGEKPLHYGMKEGSFAFASELKAMLQHPSFRDSAIDTDAIGQYLHFDYIPGPATGIANISKLAAGHVLKFDGSQIKIERYWQPVIGPGSIQRNTSHEESCRTLDSLLTESIRERLIADVPVGVFLSGGLDSSLIAAMAAPYAPGIKAYSVRIGATSYDETPYAAAVARHIGMSHEIIQLGTEDVIAAWRAVDEKLDQPFADASIVPTYLVCKAARVGVTVAIGGDGADELFAGYPNFKAARYAKLLAMAPDVLGKATRFGLDLLPHSQGYMSLPFILRQISHGLGQTPDRQCFAWMSSFAPGETEALLGPNAPPGLYPQQGIALIDQIGREIANRHPVERTQALFMATYLPEDILTKVDRASMYNSLEVRAPFLGRRVAEYALSLPAGLKLAGNRTKSILKDVAARYLPQSILDRRKHGFALPVAELLRGPLRGIVRETLLDAGCLASEWFDRDKIEIMLSQHAVGSHDHRKRLWTLFQLFRFTQNVNRFRLPILP